MAALVMTDDDGDADNDADDDANDDDEYGGDGSDDNDCDGDADEDFDLNTDLENCGTCGNACDFAGGVGSCTAGICEMAGCDSGYGDCNGDMADGCEQNLLNDVNH